MHATTQQFQEILDEAWKTEHAEAMECRKCEELIERVLLLWDQDSRDFFARAVPGSLGRADARMVASTLRLAELAMTQTVSRSMSSVARGYTVEGLNGLLASLNEVRGLIVLSISRMMSKRDPQGRTPEEISLLLARRVRFQDGRPVIDNEVAADFPSPFDAEPTP